MENLEVSEFIDLVSEDLRGNLSDDKSNDLNLEENFDLIKQALIYLKKDVESQLAIHKSKSRKKQIELANNGDDGTLWEQWLNKEQFYKAPNGEKRTTPAPIDWKTKAIKFLNVIESRFIELELEIRINKQSSSIIDELVESIFEQMEDINENAQTDSDKKVFEIARKIRK